jgi:hypothetical protein
LSSTIFGSYIALMAAVAFDTLKLAQRLEAAGLPGKQAQDIANALSETIGEAVVTREFLDLRLAELDLRLAELAARLEGKIAEVRAEILKWMFGAVGLQTLAILGGVAALLRLFGR